jgi:quercetin 2,3-dioxygenase
VTEAKIEVRRADQRFRTETDWVTSHALFSFGEHYDPTNTGFGALLVSNDEVVRAGTGYGDHPHADAEILTWVLSGSLVHADTAGHTGIVHPGLAARMSAGSGIVHAERNDAYRLDPTRPPEPAHFVQMWVRPDTPGTPPSYQQREFAPADLGRHWLPVASGNHPDALVDLATAGATLWAAVLDAGVTRDLPTGAYGHLYVARGEVEVETVGRLHTGDALRIRGEAALAVTGLAQAELLVWTMTR